MQSIFGKVETKLKEMEGKGIIRKVDLTNLNRTTEREKMAQPSVEETLGSETGS